MKIYKYILLVLTFLISTSMLWAQNARFLKSGEITYEKRVNVFALLNLIKKYSEDDNVFIERMIESYKSKQNQFVSVPSKLVFNEKNALFQYTEPPENVTIPDNYMLRMLGSLAFQKNVVHQDYGVDTLLAQKPLFEETFLIKEAMSKIKWKITEETREIAGYPCRRANGLMLDSVYVVAFYTDQILPSGGPESFYGLPGMILGVAIPHYHVTWFANKVIDRDLKPNEIVMPKKGKPSTYSELNRLIEDQMGDWIDEKMLKLMQIGAGI